MAQANEPGVRPVAAGATVELDSFGTLTLGKLTLDGRIHTSGTFDAANYPGAFIGAGTILVKPHAPKIIVK